MSNKTYSLIVCCLIFGFGSFGRGGTPEQNYTTCANNCAAAEKSCEDANLISNADCEAQEDRCYDGCLAEQQKAQSAALVACLTTAKTKKATEEKNARLVFRSTKVTIDTALKEAQKNGLKLARYFPAEAGVRNSAFQTALANFIKAKAACFSQHGKK